MAIAPPEPPSPIMTAMFGTPRSRLASVERAMASAWPRSSAPMLGYAPAVSTSDITGLAVAGQRNEVGDEGGDVIEAMGPIRMAGDLGLLPRRQVRVEILERLRRLGL